MAHVGIIHVHSKFSYDGQHTLDEIAFFARKRGYSFVGMSEHSNTFDQRKMVEFVEECRRVSDPSFLMIPGLEFTCDANLHLLALGIERFTDAKNPISIARFVRAQGGVAIVSHPGRYDFKIPSGLETAIDGIEVWNASCDGRFVPNHRSIALWKALRKRNGSLLAFGAQDLHRITRHRHVKVIVPSDQLTQEKLLRKFREGDFVVSNSYVRLSPGALPGWVKLNAIGCIRRAFLTAKAIRDRLAQ